MVTLLFTNTNASARTVTVNFLRKGGTARQIAYASLNQNESLVVAGLPVEGGDTVRAHASAATSVDYLVTGRSAGAFSVYSLDANGALKSGAAAIGSGNLTISGDLTVSGGDIDAGASGAAGSLDIFPTTASKGKLRLTATANTNDDALTLTNAAHGQATTITFPDGGAATSYVVQSTAAVTLAEADVLDGATAGTVVASKAVVVDANKDVSSFRDTVHRNIDAGASGTAGTVDVFPSTAAKGKLALACADQTGNTTVTVTAAAMAAARALSIPDPLADSSFMMGTMSSTARTATADGLTTGTIADAGYWTFVTVTSADANNIIVLPTPTPGKMVVLHVGATGYELRTSDPATVAINGGTGAGAESAIGANTTAFLFCASATSWKGWQLGSDGTLAKVEVAAA